jgi:ABC-2 type transport system permease protein
MRKAIAIARKEARQTVRDTRTLLMALLVPLLLLGLYGYALNFDIRHVPLAVQDRDHSVESREVVAAFLNSTYFDLVAVVHHEREIRQLLDENRARAVLVIPERTGRILQSGGLAAVQVLINGDNGNTAATVMAYAAETVRGVSAKLRAERLGRGTPPPIAVEPRVWFNPELSSTIFLVPGLIAFIAMITAVVLTSLSIVREKERGTMEQVRMAPVSTVSYVVGKTIPYFVLAFISAMAILVAGMLLFAVPMRGSWALLMVATGLFLFGALGQGLLISTLSDSQQIAFQIALLSSFLPTFLLSGFVFPIASMPAFVQLVTYIVPARYYLHALRGIVLKGVPLDLVLPQLGALVLFAVAVVGLAAVRLARQRE